MSTWTEREDAALLPTYQKFPFVLERGEGCWVFDDAGGKYLDLYGGHAVCLLGHCPPEVTDALDKQARKLLFYSNLSYLKVRAQAAEALVSLCGEKGSKVFFCNSGAEANENALRLAWKTTGRPKVVATAGSFHGRTAAALAATGLGKYRKGAAGLSLGVTHALFGDLEAAARNIGPDTAAVILEPIQSMAGAVTPPEGYLKGLERLCRERGALLIFDEVQTGLGRVGARSAASLYAVQPDIMTFAKGLASGVPCGAILVREGPGQGVKSGDLGSTFGGGPLACAAALATLKAISGRKLWENAAAREAQIRATFRWPALKEIRGKGLLLGLAFDRPAKDLAKALLEKKILVGTSEDPNVLRLLPPLTVSAEEIDLLRVALDEIVKVVKVVKVGTPPAFTK